MIYFDFFGLFEARPKNKVIRFWWQSESRSVSGTFINKYTYSKFYQVSFVHQEAARVLAEVCAVQLLLAIVIINTTYLAKLWLFTELLPGDVVVEVIFSVDKLRQSLQSTYSTTHLSII